MKNQTVFRSLGIAIALYTLSCFPPFGGIKGYCQNVGINATGSTPDASAMLDVSSTNTGLLIPRVSLTSTTDVVTIASPATSLLVYNTNAAMTGGAAGYWYWDGTQWAQIGAGGGSGWLLTGNAGTTAGTNFIGTTDAQDWVIKTNNAERMRILSGGNVGIGLTAPASQFHSAGQIRTGIPSGGLGGAAATTGSLLFYNSINTNTINIRSGTTSAGYTLTLPTTAPPVNNYALVGSTAGVLSWADPNPTVCLLGGNTSATAGKIDACNYWTGGAGTSIGIIKFFCFNDPWNASSGEVVNFRQQPGGIWGGSGGWTSQIVLKGTALGNVPFDLAQIHAQVVGGNFETNGTLMSFYTNPVGTTTLTERMRIDEEGQVGIGTTAPGYPLEVSGGVAIAAISQRYFTNAAALTLNSTQTPTVAIKANNAIWTTGGFYASSDNRAKENIISRNPAEALALINQLNPVKYNWIDRSKSSHTFEDGFIAQEVEKLLPEAVNTNTDVIPSIMELVEKTTLIKNQLVFNLKKSDEVKTEDVLKIITEDGAEHKWAVASVKKNEIAVYVEENIQSASKIFVYGKEVKDFKSVDYDRIFTISISAMQELSRLNKVQQKNIQELQEENKTLRAEIKNMKSDYNNRMNKIEEIVGLPGGSATKTAIESKK